MKDVRLRGINLKFYESRSVTIGGDTFRNTMDAEMEIHVSDQNHIHELEKFGVYPNNLIGRIFQDSPIRPSARVYLDSDECEIIQKAIYSILKSRADAVSRNQPK